MFLLRELVCNGSSSLFSHVTQVVCLIYRACLGLFGQLTSEYADELGRLSKLQKDSDIQVDTGGGRTEQ